MSKEVTYTGKYYQGTRADLVDKVSKQMSAKRLQHVLRVEEMALALAEIHGGEAEQVSVAALVHDYAKERPDNDFLERISQGAYPSDLSRFGNPIWHGLVGAELICDELAISDETILQAVRLHTTGAAEMSQVAKLIYVADYVETGRDFPLVEEARALAFKDLDEAVAFETEHTLNYLVTSRALIYPKTIETYNHWVVKK